MKQKELNNIVKQFGDQLNHRQQFFIGAAVKDALVLGNRSQLLTEDEALELSEAIETGMLEEARKSDAVQGFLHGRSPVCEKETNEDFEQRVEQCKQVYKEYIVPVLKIVYEQYSERFGTMLVKYIYTGEISDAGAPTDEDKFMWNVFIAIVELKFGVTLSSAYFNIEL